MGKVYGIRKINLLDGLMYLCQKKVKNKHNKLLNFVNKISLPLIIALLLFLKEQ